jgi:hypothetical protein
MRKLLVISVFALPLLFSQSPNPSIAGVWRADLEKSKIPGPPNVHYTEFLSIIEEKTVVLNRRTQEKGPEIDELTGMWGGPRGEERVALSFPVTGKPAVRPYQGIPTEMTASWEGNTLTLNAETAGRPQTVKRIYVLSQDGQTLTVSTTRTANGREQEGALVVMSKQPDSAGEPLRKPEELAETHFKNVKTSLKSLPESEFINQMRYFAWSLGKDCEFCHVRNDFPSDDKKEKKTARDMIEMVTKIDADNFKNRPEVKCFTCHEMHNHPLSYPLFPDQIAALQAQQANQNRGSGAAGSGPAPAPRPPQN